LADKWRAFNWNVIECDGNDMAGFIAAAEQAKTRIGRPTVIIAKTLMGKGVSFMEDDYKWHGVPPNEEQGKKALGELSPTELGDFIRFDWE
jgi:transketolase